MANKSRAIVKNCPKCDHSVAVASKSCKNKACGHSFFDAKRTTRSRSAQSAVDEEMLRRRTKRVRREKPNYYDSQEFDKKKKKKDRRGRPKAICQEIPQRSSKSPANTKESTAARAKRRRLRKEQENGGGDICARLTTEKQELAALILAEINRKIGSVVWRPPN
ncbi:hypothetical protein HA402_000057 [Bradysia odoriphaga]|uniref:UPF0547 protein C16orf87-like n=1 Tax=Bradysia coprophila TaxID=38358 RepID=UPI00187D73DD|nr:UPF0547 protein C16orf87-like [Bradysia coprophila]KAG4067066.1 hypothetical protein HA402_000057 [Bradysia odoriphaga]